MAIGHYDIYLSIGDGEEELSQIPVGEETVEETLREIIQELGNLDLTDLFVQLVCEINDHITWTLYGEETGIFSTWDNDFGILDRVIQTELVELITALNNTLSFCTKIVEVAEYRLITDKGEKPIFSYDDEGYYTACGISQSYQGAVVRRIA